MIPRFFCGVCCMLVQSCGTTIEKADNGVIYVCIFNLNDEMNKLNKNGVLQMLA